MSYCNLYIDELKQRYGIFGDCACGKAVRNHLQRPISNQVKVKECKACGQGFSEDNSLVGLSVPTIKCKGGLHDGPIERITVTFSQDSSNGSSIPGDDSVVFILISKYYKDGRKKKDGFDSVFPYGTAFAISPIHIVTANHIIQDNNIQNIAIVSEISDGIPVKESDTIDVKVVYYNIKEDWAILERNDGKTFLSYAIVCPESEIPKQRNYIGIKDYPCDLFTSKSVCTLALESYKYKIICYELLPSSNKRIKNNKGFPLIQNNENFNYPTRSVVRVFDERVSGSCGAPYFCKNGKVLAFQNNSNRSQIPYSSGHVLCRLEEFMKIYNSIIVSLI